MTIQKLNSKAIKPKPWITRDTGNWSYTNQNDSKCIMYITCTQDILKLSMFILSQPSYRDSSNPCPPSSHKIWLAWQLLSERQPGSRCPFSQKFSTDFVWSEQSTNFGLISFEVVLKHQPPCLSYFHLQDVFESFQFHPLILWQEDLIPLGKYGEHHHH